MAEKFYEILEHTADIRIRVRAGDLKTLFCRCARAMFDIIAEKKTTKAAGNPDKVELKVSQQAGNLEELFINWLNELLSLSASLSLIFSDFKIKSLSENYLEAAMLGELSGNYRINKEIKAATYHQLQITKSGNDWKVEVIFDV
ncbi:MAG: archease [Candidatus Omnitrophica bacterium]|nr:archease [Candidatus Omnitrophota bacterium]